MSKVDPRLNTLFAKYSKTLLIRTLILKNLSGLTRFSDYLDIIVFCILDPQPFKIGKSQIICAKESLTIRSDVQIISLGFQYVED